MIDKLSFDVNVESTVNVDLSQRTNDASLTAVLFVIHSYGGAHVELSFISSFLDSYAHRFLNLYIRC